MTSPNPSGVTVVPPGYIDPHNFAPLGSATPVTSFQPTPNQQANTTSTATANNLEICGINIPAPTRITGLIIINGTTAAGNVLAGIYSADGLSLLASSGSIAQAGTSVMQLLPFTTPVNLPPGPYWLAICFSSATATTVRVWVVRGSSVAQGGFSLPATITPPSAPGTPLFSMTY